MDREGYKHRKRSVTSLSHLLSHSPSQVLSHSLSRPFIVMPTDFTPAPEKAKSEASEDEGLDPYILAAKSNADKRRKKEKRSKSAIVGDELADPMEAYLAKKRRKEEKKARAAK